MLSLRRSILRTQRPSMISNSLRRSVFDWQIPAAVASLGVIGVSLLRAYPQFKEVKRDVGELLPESIPPALDKARVTTSASEAEYVSRPGLEAQINTFLDSSKNVSYCVVYGAKGVGKSEVVDHSAIGKRAVLKVPVTTIGTRDDLVALIMSKLTGKKISLDIDKLIEVLKKCKVGGFIPTIIFDVERGSSSERTSMLQDVRSLAKALIGYCRCIIVLSEANAVLEFGKDPDREEFIFVDEMTFSEAKHFLQVRGGKFSDEEMQNMFDKVGTSPARLIKLMNYVQNRNTTLKVCVDGILRVAHQDLLKFQLKPILKALKECLDGISPDYFSNKKYEGRNRLVRPIIG